jgi:hypothetical protein
MFELLQEFIEEFLDGTRQVVANSVDALVSISELFIAAPVTVFHPPPPPPPPPPSVVKIVYLYGEWVPPYEQILCADPNFTEFQFEIVIHKYDFYQSTRGCFRCRNTEPGCKKCQRKWRDAPSEEQLDVLVKNAKQDAKLKIDNMLNDVQKFRDACKMFGKTVFEGLSYLHFLRMVQNSTLQDRRYLPLPSFNFSDFDGFFRKTAIFYPVSQQLKDTGMKCKISDKDLMGFVQFLNSRERIYPEFGNVSTRNELLALSMSMRILSRLVSSNENTHSRRDQLLSRTLIANQISSRIIARKLVPPAPKK